MKLSFEFVSAIVEPSQWERGDTTVVHKHLCHVEQRLLSSRNWRLETVVLWRQGRSTNQKGNRNNSLVHLFAALLFSFCLLLVKNLPTWINNLFLTVYVYYKLKMFFCTCIFITKIALKEINTFLLAKSIY